MALVDNDGGRPVLGTGKGTERAGAKKRGAATKPEKSGTTRPAATARTRSKGGLSFERRFTERGKDPLDGVTWERAVMDSGRCGALQLTSRTACPGSAGPATP